MVGGHFQNFLILYSGGGHENGHSVPPRFDTTMRALTLALLPKTATWLFALALVACGGGGNPAQTGQQSAPLSAAGTPASAAGLVRDDGGKAQRYVAMGDSAAAAPLVPGDVRTPASCIRSGNNYPSLVASELAVNAFQDMTCSGAKTDHFFEAQEDNPPQLSAVTADTTLVTIGPIGANDIQTTIPFLECINPLPPGVGPACLVNSRGDEDDTTRYGKPLATVKANLEKAIASIHATAPNASIFLVGYGVYFPPGGCWPQQPYWPETADFIQSLHNRVNAVLKQVAEGSGASYIEAQTPDAISHSPCAPVLNRWIAGLVPDRVSVLFHPTDIGAQGNARIVVGAIKGR